MSDYFISPMWFYLIGLFERVNDFFGTILILTGIFGGIIIICSLVLVLVVAVEDVEIPEINESIKRTTQIKWITKFCKGWIILVIISAIGFTFIPTKSTCIEMMVADTITHSNVDYATEKVIDIIDHIVDKAAEETEIKE